MLSARCCLHANVCTLLSARCCLHSAVCPLLSARCCLHAAVCTLLSARCSLHAAVCTLLSARCCLHAAVCTLLSARCCLHAAVCTLLSARCCLHAAVCTLLSARCCLPAVCPLLSALCCLHAAVCTLLSVVLSQFSQYEDPLPSAHHCENALIVRVKVELNDHRLKTGLWHHSGAYGVFLIIILCLYKRSDNNDNCLSLILAGFRHYSSGVMVVTCACDQDVMYSGFFRVVIVRDRIFLHSYEESETGTESRE
ncbi:Phospho-N-acetylmuramoyl-pentapeptide-transferase [Dissostichus eleginoides]|uniref:Phospho-N-acetylmuramoyl-pentapeptide-transferase n=1 Tax=Dissostichus eleginoides TaxID=100907 RepID=A0AAD9BTH5_DISEL|nr:Phospho-N-acetylmuramoyl-pentapeptide-transferase [Dissostichus eleginoides]